MKVCYVAGPYTADTDEQINANIAAVGRVSAELWDLGFAVICPHMNTARFEGIWKNTSWAGVLEGDLEIISRCDFIVMLPTWEKSKGARKEHEHAKKLGLQIIYWPELPSEKEE